MRGASWRAEGQRISFTGAQELEATGATVAGAACPFRNAVFRDARPGISKTPPKLTDIAPIAAAGLASIDGPAARAD